VAIRAAECAEAETRRAAGHHSGNYFHVLHRRRNLAAFQACRPHKLTALTAGDVRDYLNGHCDKENGAATWRIYDKDARTYRTNRRNGRTSLPYLKNRGLADSIAIKSGRRWTKPQPLPKDTASLLTLLKKYGGK
jgi:hypothetical protein